MVLQLQPMSFSLEIRCKKAIECADSSDADPKRRLTDFLVVDRGDFVQREVEEGRGIHVAGLLHALLHRVAAIHRGRDESEDRRSCAPLKPTTREAGGQSKAIQNPRQGGQAGS